MHLTNRLQLIKKVSDIKAELKEDLSFDIMTIEKKLSHHPNTMVKWSDRYNKAKVRVAKLEIERRVVIRNAYNYYTGRGIDKNGKKCPLVLDQREIRDVYLPSNDDVIEIEKKIEAAKAATRELYAATEQVKQLYWSMKTWLEFKKFEAGMN